MRRGCEQTNLVLRVRSGAGAKAYWDAQWRYRTGPGEEWRLKKQRLGLAWQEQGPDREWRKRRVAVLADGWTSTQPTSQRLRRCRSTSEI